MYITRALLRNNRPAPGPNGPALFRYYPVQCFRTGAAHICSACDRLCAVRSERRWAVRLSGCLTSLVEEFLRFVRLMVRVRCHGAEFSAEMVHISVLSTWPNGDVYSPPNFLKGHIRHIAFVSLHININCHHVQALIRSCSIFAIKGYRVAGSSAAAGRSTAAL